MNTIDCRGIFGMCETSMKELFYDNKLIIFAK